MWLWEFSLPNWIVAAYFAVSGFVMWMQHREIARLDARK